MLSRALVLNNIYDEQSLSPNTRNVLDECFFARFDVESALLVVQVVCLNEKSHLLDCLSQVYPRIS